METVNKAQGWIQGILDKALGEALPWVIAIIIIIIGYFVAKIIAGLVRRALGMTNLDEKLAKALGNNSGGTEKGIATFVFWLIMLFVIMIALNQANLEEAVEPIREMISSILGFLPNILGAGIIMFVAWVIATVAKNLLSALLNASRVDERLGLGESKPISSSISLVAFFGIILMMLPPALEALDMSQISDPIGELVSQIFNYIPSLFAGAVVFAIGYLIASIVQKVLSSVLSSAGADNLPAKLGFTGDMGGRSFSSIVSYVAMATILVVIGTQALQIMNLGIISELAQGLIGVYGNILVALIIFAVAFYIANIVSKLIPNAFWARFARIAIILFLGAVALQKANISNLTNDTFQLIISCVIIAAAFAAGVGGAIAIGLGGRDKAHSLLDRIR